MRETPAGLEIVDGHLRAETTPDVEVPVLVLDITDAEADKLLATLDPLAGMATADPDLLSGLLVGIQTESEAVQRLLSRLEGEAIGPNDPEAEWQGMPEFHQEDQTAWKTIRVHFASQEDMDAFAEQLGQPLTEKTQGIWYPEAAIDHYVNNRYVAEP